MELGEPLELGEPAEPGEPGEPEDFGVHAVRDVCGVAPPGTFAAFVGCTTVVILVSGVLADPDIGQWHVTCAVRVRRCAAEDCQAGTAARGPVALAVCAPAFWALVSWALSPVTSVLNITDAELAGPISGNTQCAMYGFIVHAATFDLRVMPAMPGGKATDRWTERTVDRPRFAIVAV